MNLIGKSLSFFSNHVRQFTKQHLHLFSRTLSQQQVIVPTEDTLTGRIFHYLNNTKENNATYSDAQKDLFNNYLKSKKQLYKMNNTEMMKFSDLLCENTVPKIEQLTILKEMDVELCIRLSELNDVEILKLLNIYMQILSSRITEFAFYRKSLSTLYNSIDHMNKKQLLQFMFYVGLKKKCPDGQKMLKECVGLMNSNYVNSLTQEELCIVCNVTFKTSTKITNKKLLEKVREHINDNLSILNDPALFVTLVKTLRHNNYQNDDLLNTISCTILFNKTYKQYTFPIICHILALFADYCFYDERLFKLLKQQCMKELDDSNFISKKAHPSTHLRGKDIKRFLWIMSIFNEIRMCDHSNIKNVIVPKLIERINGGEFDKDLNSLVEITLYLWMLNYRAYELVPYFINKDTVQELAYNARSKVRLQLLLNAIAIEDIDLSKRLPIKPISIPFDKSSSYQLHKRPILQRVCSVLNGLKREICLSKFELRQQIPYLNVIGITGFKNKIKIVHVEVLDEFNKVKNVEEEVPNGLMSFKMRLLDSSEQGVLMVSAREVETMTEKDLKEYLLDEMKLII